MTRGLVRYLVFGGVTLGLYSTGGFAGWWRAAAVSSFFRPSPTSTPYGPSGYGSGGSSGYRPPSGSGGHGIGYGGGSGGSSGGGFRGGK